MAIAYARPQIISRSAGRSAVACAAYRAGEKLHDERYGKTQDYEHRSGVIACGILTPANAPDWMRDREQLWNAVERREERSTRPDGAQLAREMVIALPHELDDQSREFLLKNILKEAATRKGMVADYAIHAPDREGDNRNCHAHVMLTLREIDRDDPDGFGAKAREWNSKQELTAFKHIIERETNRMLERRGIEERVTFAWDNSREAQQHMGHAATALERQGQPTEVGNANRAIAERNRDRAELKPLNAELGDVRRDIAGELARQAAQEATRQHEPEEPRRLAREGEDAAPRLAVLGNSAGRVLGYALRTLGDVLDYFMGTTPAHGPAPKTEAVPEPEPTIQEQRQQTLRTSAETIGQDPNAQSLAQSMNLDEDIRQRAAEIARQQRENWLEEERERDR